MSSKPITLYNYAFSPFGKRITAYLALRGIKYALCDQPFTMPRPDLALLGVHYRRIPVLAIGRDIYLDTRLILRRLESLPDIASPKLGATQPQDKFVEKLIEKYIIEGPVFGMAGGLVPLEVVQDEAFRRDRQGMMGRSWSREELNEGRGECLNYMRNLFAFFEDTIFEDRREWVLGGEGPRLADIEAIFMLDFASGMLPEDVVSEKLFPHVFAWLARYHAAVDKAKSSASQPTALDGEAAAKRILESELGHPQTPFDGGDPAKLKEGMQVEVYPVDWVTEHRDQGRLVGLIADEVTIAVKSKGDVEIRIHAPRTGFKVREI